MNKETILDILINGCEISQDKTGEVRYEYSQEQFEQVVKKLVNKTNGIHDVSHTYYQVVFDGVNDDMQEVTAGLPTIERAKKALEENKKHFQEPMYIIARINCG